ncbi:hypothetical protein C0Q70_21084 [Pomacea canaliculata]|uniref:RING-type E3 ubiquitin transferase n=2 Tax=Pomacea canaliculata TaxID=400727 RepID=A0A2T7NBJ9_POMCA|nr:hypothetical protein C0Q70_21084 [Pomacea canaliculata]
MPCFKKNVEEGSFTCPLCRTRISNWARKATKNNTLVDQKRWEQVKKLFPEKVQRRLDGLDDETDDDDVNDNEEIDVQYRRIGQLSKPGEIREEYEAEVKKLAERAEEERRREEEASAALIQELVTADEHIQENRSMLEEIARQDEKLAKELAERVDITDAENPVHSTCKKSKGGSLNENPSHLPNGNFKEKGKQLANKQGRTLKTFFRPLASVVNPHSFKDADSKLSVNELPQKNSQESHQTFRQRSPSPTFVKTADDTVLESEHACKAICQGGDCEETAQHQIQKYEAMPVDPKASDTAGIKLMQNLDSNTDEKFRQQTARGSLLTSDQGLTCLDYVTPHPKPATHSLTQQSAGVTLNPLDPITSTSPSVTQHSPPSRKVTAGEEPVPADKTSNMCSTCSGDDSCENSELRENGKCTQESGAGHALLPTEFHTGQDKTTDQQMILKKKVAQSSPPATKVVLQEKLTPGLCSIATERHEAWSWQALNQELPTASKSKHKIEKDLSPSTSPAPNKNGQLLGKDLSSIPPIVPGHTSPMSRLDLNSTTVPEWSGGFNADMVTSNKAVPSVVPSILDTVENVTVFKTNSHLAGSTDETSANKSIETPRKVCLDTATHGMSLEEIRENKEICNPALSDKEKNVLAKSSSTICRRNATKTRSSSATVERSDFQNFSPQRSIKDWLSPSSGNMQSTSIDPDFGVDAIVVLSSSSESTVLNPCAETFKTKTSVHLAKSKKRSAETLLLSRNSKGAKSKLKTVFKNPTKKVSQTSCKRKVPKDQDSNCSDLSGVSPSKSRKDSSDSSNEDDEVGLSQEERDYRFALQLQKQFRLADKLHLQVLRFKGSNDAYSLRKGNQHK